MGSVDISNIHRGIRSFSVVTRVLTHNHIEDMEDEDDQRWMTYCSVQSSISTHHRYSGNQQHNRTWVTPTRVAAFTLTG